MTIRVLTIVPFIDNGIHIFNKRDTGHMKTIWSRFYDMNYFNYDRGYVALFESLTGPVNKKFDKHFIAF